MLLLLLDSHSLQEAADVEVTGYGWPPNMRPFDDGENPLDPQPNGPGGDPPDMNDD